MPVPSTDFKSDLFDEMNATVLNKMNPPTAPLLSDDIWKKFDFSFDFPNDFPFFDDIWEWEDMNISNIIADLPMTTPNAKSSVDPSSCEIRNHDCMWAGTCASKEHREDEILCKQYLRAGSPPGPPATPVKRPISNNAGRSLLLSSRITQNTVETTTTFLANRPESPPSSDDEELNTITLKNGQTTTLKLLNESLSDCELDEDSDLCEYFYDSDDFVGIDEKEEKVHQSTRSHVGESDHSYHKGKIQPMRTDHLGVQTPSDSEEEIDVVSVGEKQLNTRIVSSLPTNPSTRDRQQLQRTVASAITNKRISGGGIKTLLPLRRPTQEESPQVRKRVTQTANAETRGVKRSRFQARAQSSANKRRSVHQQQQQQQQQSSDSEEQPESSERRSLHNNMERQRRVDLRNAFDDLRVLVPQLNQKERAAKVVILREAAHYCDHLSMKSADMFRQVVELRKHQERLRARVSQLRRSLAAKR